MSFSPGRNAQAYVQVGIETGVATASPHQLILMLFDGALLAIAKADNAMRKRAMGEKAESIARATDIIASGLRASLDFSKGDEIASRLAGLYDYMVRRLIDANVSNNPVALQEVSGLLNELRSAWQEISDDPVVVSANTR